MGWRLAHALLRICCCVPVIKYFCEVNAMLARRRARERTPDAGDQDLGFWLGWYPLSVMADITSEMFSLLFNHDQVAGPGWSTPGKVFLALHIFVKVFEVRRRTVRYMEGTAGLSGTIAHLHRRRTRFTRRTLRLFFPSPSEIFWSIAKFLETSSAGAATLSESLL